MNNEIKDNDLTGRDRFLWNLITSWLSYLILILAGFIMPRMIHNHVGQISLGVWDFCWSIVSYLNLAGLGIGSSMNRYVAKYQAAGDQINLQQTISAVAAIQLVLALIISLFTLLLFIVLPQVFGEALEGEVFTTQWIVALLGISVAIHMAFDTYRGVITGFHRWDLYNILHAGSHLVVFIAMVVALQTGGGLISMAAIYFIVMLLTELLRMTMAYRIYPQLEIKPFSAQWSHMRLLLGYGSKVIVVGMSPLLLVLTANVIVVSNLGLSALAILSRPLALLRHMENLLNKYFHMLTPTTGSLMGVGKKSEISKFLLNSTMYGVALTLPLVVILCLYGDLVMTVWMGQEYVNYSVIIILAVGYMLPLAQTPVLRVMMGVNKHGIIGFISLLIMSAGLIVWITILNVHGWDLVGTAFMIGTTLTMANGIVIPIYSCKLLKIPYIKYLRQVFLKPMAACILFGVWLWVIRIMLEAHPWMTIITGISSGLIILCVLYWYNIIPESLKIKMRKKYLLPISISISQ